MSVNGRRVRHHSEYGAARKLRSDEIELVVVRDGREITLVASDLAAKAAPPADSREPETGQCELAWRCLTQRIQSPLDTSARSQDFVQKLT
jgi:hypothetical protein